MSKREASVLSRQVGVIEEVSEDLDVLSHVKSFNTFQNILGEIALVSLHRGRGGRGGGGRRRRVKSWVSRRCGHGSRVIMMRERCVRRVNHQAPCGKTTMLVKKPRGEIERLRSNDRREGRFRWQDRRRRILGGGRCREVMERN